MTSETSATPSGESESTIGEKFNAALEAVADFAYYTGDGIASAAKGLQNTFCVNYSGFSCCLGPRKENVEYDCFVNDQETNDSGAYNSKKFR